MNFARIYLLLIIVLAFSACTKKTEEPKPSEPEPELRFDVTTFAGDGVYRNKDGLLKDCSFTYLKGIITDSKGYMYAADGWPQYIRKISPDGLVSSIFVKYLNDHSSLALDSDGNLFVSTNSGKRIMKITPDGEMSLFAGGSKTGDQNGPGASATFSSIGGMTFDKLGNLYVADYYNHQIRKITPDGIVSKVPGTGIIVEENRTYINIHQPTSVAVDPLGNLFVGHTWGIAKIDPSGKVSDFGPQGVFGGVTNMVMDAKGNLYVTIITKNNIEKISSEGKHTHVAGTGEQGYQDGEGKVAKFYGPQGITISNDNKYLYVADATNYRIRKIDLQQ